MMFGCIFVNLEGRKIREKKTHVHGQNIEKSLGLSSNPQVLQHNFLAQKVAFPSLKSHWTAGLGGSGLPNQSFSVYNIILAIINSILTI